MSQGKPTHAQATKYSENWILYGDQTRAWKVTFPDSKCKPETANYKASLFHKLETIQKRINELKLIRKKIADEKCGLNAEYVARRLKEMDELDILDIMEDDLVSFKSLSEWPKSWRTSISGLDLMTISSGNENITSVIKKIKWPNKVQNLELIGKLADVSAFKENLNLSGHVRVERSFNDFYDED